MRTTCLYKTLLFSFSLILSSPPPLMGAQKDLILRAMPTKPPLLSSLFSHSDSYHLHKLYKNDNSASFLETSTLKSLNKRLQSSLESKKKEGINNFLWLFSKNHTQFYMDDLQETITRALEEIDLNFYETLFLLTQKDQQTSDEYKNIADSYNFSNLTSLQPLKDQHQLIFVHPTGLMMRVKQRKNQFSLSFYKKSYLLTLQDFLTDPHNDMKKDKVTCLLHAEKRSRYEACKLLMRLDSDNTLRIATVPGVPQALHLHQLLHKILPRNTHDTLEIERQLRTDSTFYDNLRFLVFDKIMYLGHLNINLS